MAEHETVYGICENKCRHEVYRKDEADNTFLKKTAAGDTYAVKNHATSKQTYGIGTSSVYGHLMLTGSLNVPSQASNGVALAAGAGKVLNDKIITITDKINDEIIPAVDVIGGKINEEIIPAITEMSRVISEIAEALNDLDARVRALEDAQ
jgi:hypothetical protein